MQQFTTYQSTLFREYRGISATDFQAMVHFFERNEAEICSLEFDEYFEMLSAYVASLFEMGAYEKHLFMAEVVIEASIENNIHFYKGQDIFKYTLFKKAASHFNLMDYDKAEHILKELLKMEPDNEDSLSFLKKVLRSRKSELQKNTRATAMFCFLITPVIICIDILIIQSFYNHLSPTFNLAWTSLFIIGWAILLSGDLWHRFASHRGAEQFLNSIK
ncbi:MAG: hypothetical protein R2879_02290 [Saprospiraceae bacterium]